MNRNQSRSVIHPVRLLRPNDPPSRPIDFEVSDSYDSSNYYSSSYYSDSIPMISTNTTTNSIHRPNRVHNTALLFSDDSQDDGGETNPTQIYIDNNVPQENNENEIPTNLFEVEESSTQNDQSSNNNNNNIAATATNPQIYQSDEISNNQETPQNLSDENQQNNIDDDQNSINANSSSISAINSNNNPVYKLSWSRSGFFKNNIQMVYNDNILFQAKKVKTELGKSYIICSDSNVERFSNSYIGSLKISQHKRRFTLFVPCNGNPGDRHCEMMGLSFFSPRDVNVYGIRAFRVAIPRNNNQYFPSSSDMNLSKIAKRNVNLDDFIIYSTKLPEVRNDVLVLNFHDSDVMASIKNFIIEDENEKMIFKIYKSTIDQKCSIMIDNPITPLIAFCIAIAIIITN